jgi:nucleoside diphosphate kinase
MGIENVLVFIKPDGLYLKKEILSALATDGYTCEKIGMIGFNESLIRCFYPLLPDNVVKKCITYFGDNLLPTYYIRGPLAIRQVKIIKREFRQKYGNGRTGSIMHSTNEVSEFELELRRLSLFVPIK